MRHWTGRRIGFDAKDPYPSQRTGIESLAGKSGGRAEMLRKRLRQGERDSGVRPGATTAEQHCIKYLAHELRKADETLKLASAHFVQAEFDRHHRK